MDKFLTQSETAAMAILVSGVVIAVVVTGWFVVFWMLITLLLGVWLVFNLLAPYSVLAQAERISPGRLPAELLIWPKDKKVRFYMTTLSGGYGYSVWAPPFDIVVFDRVFFKRAPPTLIRYVVAHELAHFTLGHHRKRWFAVVTGLVMFPAVRRWLLRMEDEADVVAETRTGFPRSAFPELGG